MLFPHKIDTCKKIVHPVASCSPELARAISHTRSMTQPRTRGLLARLGLGILGPKRTTAFIAHIR